VVALCGPCHTLAHHPKNKALQNAAIARRQTARGKTSGFAPHYMKEDA
jgi:hypothetical protein